MKFGLQLPAHIGGNSFEVVKSAALLAETEDYDSFWIMDHLVQIEYAGKVEDPILEAFTTLSALSSIATKIKLGTLCTNNLFRNPALLAKMIASIEEISEGRFWLGIGAGWFGEEAEMYGCDFPDLRTRVEMLEESLKIIRGSLTSNNFSFQGKYYSVKDIIVSPRPRKTPPILIGGGNRKVLRLVAKYGDACNLFPKGEELDRKLEMLKEECRLAGRKYSSILKSKLSSVMFGANRANALQRISKFKPASMSLDAYAKSALLGNPKEIAEEAEHYERQGIDYLIVNFRGKFDAANVKKFSHEVMRSF